MNCEECNFYIEEYSQDAKDNIPYCVKHKKYIKENDVCNDFNNNISCFNCPERYEIYYEINDIEHYCKKYNVLLYQQMRSVLYKGDFKKGKVCVCQHQWNLMLGIKFMNQKRMFQIIKFEPNVDLIESCGECCEKVEWDRKWNSYIFQQRRIEIYCYDLVTQNLYVQTFRV